jgi:hypothetical protein
LWLFIKGCGGRDQPDKKISRLRWHQFMPKGLKPTSQQIMISGSLAESGPNTLTTSTVDLQLNVLDREVFVCSAADVNAFPPDGIAATDTQTAASLSTTSRTSIGTMADSNVIAVNNKTIRAAGFADAGVGFQERHPELLGSDLEYIAIISTNDFHVQVLGVNNTNPRGVDFRIWGYRAVADAATFAALTQSELLSA